LTGRQTDESRLGAVIQNGEKRVVLECRERDQGFRVLVGINELYEGRDRAQLSVDVREDGLELRGARGHGTLIAEHVNVPDAGNKGGDRRAVVLGIGIVVDGHPVMEGGESGSIVVVRVGRE
jgi:hypothetical protein